MEQQRASELLRGERERLTSLLAHTAADGVIEREGANEQGDLSDSAEPFTSEEENDAIARGLQQRLEAVQRAEQRLGDGTYGLSVLSGEPLSDARLEADPAAELTVEEMETA
jgi:DnaK suppressor protein